ncbi:hypothetical protein K439DRAFT_70058 [Ramaria rubella]|nr:hypothetical protein K439DRAFT_70058 [Ramaria rubella]
MQIQDGLVAITGDAKAQMQFDLYEKLIVVEKGIELINCPDDVPFINTSAISSMPILWQLHSALTLDDVDAHCHWVTLTEEEWKIRRTAYHEAHAQDQPMKRKRKVPADEDSESSSSSSSKAKVSERQPKKPARKATESGKENQASCVASGSKPKQKTRPAVWLPVASQNRKPKVKLPVVARSPRSLQGKAK